MKIGIMGGTFNPIHNGHLLIGEYARTELELSQVIYMASGEPAHKSNSELISGEERYKLISLAIKDNPYFKNSNLEIKRKGKTYTVDTIREINKNYPNVDLHFLIGEDSLFSLENWMKFEDLCNMCKFIVFSRGLEDRVKVIEHIKYLRDEYNMEIDFLESPIIQISSTEIRQRIKENLSIKYLVPFSVEDYILKNNIYGAD